MNFTPPSCNLGIDRTQDEPPIDIEPIAFYFPTGMALTMVRPILDGRKAMKYDCGYYMLEYLAKREGRKLQAISKETVVKHHKILTWNWVTNGDFNKRPSARHFIDEAVKTACQKYK
ncbi:hypothetical protein ZWY2020_056931 [Hordeum vulgare]|nr:hypothetical protein ZWY2020_056931 [Hordeum vulgare]